MRYLRIPLNIIPVSGERAVWRVDGLTIAIFNVSDTLHAIDDGCPHAGASLSNGKLDGRFVQCRAHGLQFDLLTGCARTSRNFGVRTYIIEQRDGQPHIVLQDKDTVA